MYTTIVGGGSVVKTNDQQVVILNPSTAEVLLGLLSKDFNFHLLSSVVSHLE